MIYYENDNMVVSIAFVRSLRTGSEFLLSCLHIPTKVGPSIIIEQSLPYCKANNLESRDGDNKVYWNPIRASWIFFYDTVTTHTSSNPSNNRAARPR